MVKKKTRVIMPGGISGLVNKVQGIEKPTVTPPAEPEPEEEIAPEPEPIREPVHHASGTCRRERQVGSGS